MQIFYHGTRDIEPPAAARRGPPSRASRRCEACGRRLEDAESSEGAGLAFCGDCRVRLDRSAIQIHFCDACGVSVPLDAVVAGSALAPDGRILCAACRASGRPGRPVVVRAVLLALGALALGAAAAWLL